MRWQILIATIVDRKEQFDLLFKELTRQIDELNLSNEVGILFDLDNREKSIGKKRQDLLEKSTATYISFFDDDDFPYPDYVNAIYEALLSDPDCVGMLIDMTTDGKRPQVCCHSLKYKVWENNKDGYDYVRNITHFNTSKRSLAIQVGFEDMRYAEDRAYSDKLTSKCKSEVFISKPLFHYRYTTHISHAEKYGFTQK